MKDFDKFYQLYEQARQVTGNKTNIVLHFRTATHGTRGIANTHPFFISPRLAFVHNGIISGLHDQKKSDTRLFCEMMRKLPAGLIGYPVFTDLLGLLGSKLVFLDAQGRFKIIGKGEWHKGCWYSNSGYKTRAVSWWDRYPDAYGDSYSWRSGWDNFKAKAQASSAVMDLC